MTSQTYRVVSLILFLIFILNASISRSEILESSQVWKSNEKNVYYFLFEENEKYTVNKILIPQNELQEVLESKIFSNFNSAQEYVKEKNVIAVSKSQLRFTKIQTERPNKVLWPTKNEWSWDWEVKYGEWVKENVKENFFINHNIKTDCADVAFALRWIFARINYLPAAQTTVVSNRIFSNESMKKAWENLPTAENWREDELFLAGLEYMMDNTYTHSLYLDSYPILINRTALLLGTHYLALREHGGHTLFVNEFYKNKTIYTVNSDVPRIVRKLERYGFWTTYQPKFHETAEAGGGGFLKLRWPKRVANGFALVNKSEMPFYSVEQYADDFITNNYKDFGQEVHKRFGVVTTPPEQLNGMITKIISSYQSRVKIVENGFEFCSVNNCEEGTMNYEDHSTPARDAKILETISTVEDLIFAFGEEYPEMEETWNGKLLEIVVNIDGRMLRLTDLVYIWKNKRYSYDPSDSILKRWGLE